MPCRKSGSGPVGGSDGGGAVFSLSAIIWCVLSRTSLSGGSFPSTLCAVGSSTFKFGSIGPSVIDEGVTVSNFDPASGVATLAPAPETVPAAGPPILMPSCGFHVWSFGKLVPGDVCRADFAVVGKGLGGGGFGFVDAGGGGGGRGGFEANGRILREVLAITGDAYRRCEGVKAGRTALRATWGSMVDTNGWRKQWDSTVLSRYHRRELQ